MILIPDIGDSLDRCIARFDVCPWSTLAGSSKRRFRTPSRGLGQVLYTPEQRRRRDESPWTLVQGVLAPLQFGVFLISLVLVLRFLATGIGFEAATASIILKTIVLYAIMVTGAIWERAVFGQYLFARAFFWEDVVSILVIGLHTAYLVVLATGALSAHGQMILALAAYVAYVVNATQFLLKLRAARRAEGLRAAELRPA